MRLGALVGLAVLASASACGNVSAQEIPYENLVAVYGCESSDATYTFYTVPAGYVFLLTDLYVGMSEGGQMGGNRTFEIQASGVTQQQYLLLYRYPRDLSYTLELNLNLSSPIPFVEGDMVQGQIPTPCGTNWCASINGYLVDAAPASIGAADQIPSALGDVRLSILPNPATGLAKVKFALERESRACLDIFSVDGRRVIRLADAELPRGIHEFSWDKRNERGERVAAGTYFPRLTVNGEIATSKLVVLE